MTDLFFDQEFKAVIPPLSAEEYEGLTQSLIKEGNRDPVVIWKETKFLLDGHNRYDICHKHNIPLKPALELSFPDRESAIVWIIDNQLNRRNLITWQRGTLVLKKEGILAAKAKERQGERTDLHPSNFRPNSDESLSKPMDRRVLGQLSKQANVGHDTMARIMYIDKRATPEVKQELASGNLTINQVYQEIKNNGNHIIATKWTGDHESYTPAIYIEASRKVMGSIDLDPASNALAQNIVKADKYYTLEDDGLKHEWEGNIFLNPPYSHPEIVYFVDKLLNVLQNGQQAILLTNNNTDTNFFHRAAKRASAICFTKGRINFHKPDGSISSPTNGQIFYYYGNNVGVFTDTFSEFGLIMRVI